MICILSRADVRQALPMRLAIETMKQAFVQLSTGKADVPLRTRLLVPSHAGMTLFMPAYLSETDQMAVKIVSVFNENLAKGLPLIHALVVVVDATTGKPSAVMDGSYLTALRTGAASGAATDLLARQDTHSVFVFGAGVQGRTQLEAVCTVRPIQQAWVYDVDSGRALEFAAEMSVQLSIPIVVAMNPSRRRAKPILSAPPPLRLHLSSRMLISGLALTSTPLAATPPRCRRSPRKRYPAQKSSLTTARPAWSRQETCSSPFKRVTSHPRTFTPNSERSSLDSGPGGLHQMRSLYLNP